MKDNEVNELINNIKETSKAIQKYEVKLTVDDFVFNGVVPFDLFIKENEVTATLYDTSYEEAEKKVYEFFGK
jgi:antitoxin component of RelBE/YafQ-DinJ toxin-antitoxin module